MWGTRRSTRGTLLSVHPRCVVLPYCGARGITHGRPSGALTTMHRRRTARWARPSPPRYRVGHMRPHGELRTCITDRTYVDLIYNDSWNVITSQRPPCNRSGMSLIYIGFSRKMSLCDPPDTVGTSRVRRNYAATISSLGLKDFVPMTARFSNDVTRAYPLCIRASATTYARRRRIGWGSGPRCAPNLKPLGESAC